MEERIKYLRAFVLFVFRRYGRNNCPSIAAELTVTSLLALVPLTAVVFALLAFVPSFQHLGEELQTLLFKYFVPGTGETVQAYINEFVGKAKGLSGVGTLMLFVTALLMMRTIDSSFNKIWQVESDKSAVRTILVYWAILTLGPILLGSSLLITSYIQSLPVISDVVSSEDFNFSRWLPFLMACLSFSVMFFVIPNRKIPVAHALFSGILTAILFEVAKFGFGVFVSKFSTYQLIFGALASVPLFLIWIYLSWAIVLFGAEFCHALDNYEASVDNKDQHPFLEVLSLIEVLAEFQRKGETMDELELKSLQEEGKSTLNFDWLEKMVESGLVAKCQDQSYCLIRAAEDLDWMSVYQTAERQLPSKDEIEQSELPEKTKSGLLALSNHIQSGLNDRLAI